MNNSRFYQALLLGAAALFVGCTSSEDIITKDSPPVLQEWIASATVTTDSMDVNDEETRAYFYGGNTRRYYTLWDQDDVVRIYKGNDLVGTMSPPSSSWGNYRATLTGTLTGSFAANDVLSLYMPTKSMTFTGQKGTIYDLSAHYAFQYATTTVEEAANQILSLSSVGMSHRSVYLRFELQDADTGSRLHPSELVISATNGDVVLTVDEEGNATTGDLTVTTEEDTGGYPGEIFVSLLNANNDNVTYRLKATVGTDIYVGPANRAFTFNPRNYIGVLNRVNRTMIKTTAASTLTVTDIPSRHFTGSAYEPTLEVKDGEETLTLATDYSVAYSDNVNVGEATATITGLADAGAVASTKYLGTQDVAYSITAAVPVITLATEDMTLEEGSTTQLRAVTAVTIDNSDYGLSDLDIMNACTVTYVSGDTGVATVNETTGEVNAGVTKGTTTITAIVSADANGNWVTATKSYTVVNERPRVDTDGNSEWSTTEDAEEYNIYQ